MVDLCYSSDHNSFIPLIRLSDYLILFSYEYLAKQME